MDKDKLIQEMNELSDTKGLSDEQKAQNKERMIEIAKTLLRDHYGYTSREDVDIEHKKDKEVNIDNFYNGD